LSEAGEPSCTDAVIVLPGIMGSELVDVASGDVLWGLADPRWYVSAWTTGEALRRLAVTEAERGGDTRRVRATRLLATPAAVPLFHGVEPYTRLRAAVRRACAHPDAVVDFPYDWRLPVTHNAARLGRLAEEHLAAWRRHPSWAGRRADPRAARLTLVAHSMGGLVARQYIDDLGDAAEVRLLITLGTPFYGAVKAAYTLSSGRGTVPPLPRRRLRELVRTMPGLYDLLPSYRCVTSAGAPDRRLTRSEGAARGGDPELAGWALAGAERSWRDGGPALRTMVGVDQPTMQAMRLDAGEVVAEYSLGGADHRGDSTVYRRSASTGAVTPSYLPQSHVALAKTDETVAFVRAVLTEGVLGPPLPGAAEVGLDVPDVVVAGEPFEIRVAGADPAAAVCRVMEADTNVRLPPPPRLRPGAGGGPARTVARFDRPGIYRVLAEGSGYSAVSQLVLAVPAGAGEAA
jgi:hypothetical protein